MRSFSITRTARPWTTIFLSYKCYVITISKRIHIRCTAQHCNILNYSIITSSVCYMSRYELLRIIAILNFLTIILMTSSQRWRRHYAFTSARDDFCSKSVSRRKKNETEVTITIVVRAQVYIFIPRRSHSPINNRI